MASGESRDPTAVPTWPSRVAGGSGVAVVPGKHEARTGAQVRASKGMAGGGLLSRRRPSAVPSTLPGLTAVFGMGTGVAPARWSPAKTRTVPSCQLRATASQGKELIEEG